MTEMNAASHMDEHLKQIMDIEAVRGVLYFSFEGEILVQHDTQNAFQGLNRMRLALFSAELHNIQEAELVFEDLILYIVRGLGGYLLAALSRSAPVALVRLNANILLAALDKESRKPRGLARFLKRKS